MMAFKVFVSSVMGAEDLSAERAVTLQVLESLQPVVEPWAFERAPASSKRLHDSYIDEVKNCDVFVLILGSVLTPAVQEEFETARDHGKALLVFPKNVSDRQPEAQALLGAIDAKYDRFLTTEELRGKLRVALGHEILRRTKGEGLLAAEGDSVPATLRKYASARQRVRVSPLVPACQYDIFSVEKLEGSAVTLNKSSTDEYVALPLKRVAEVLPDALDELPTLALNGRLQWLTIPQRWKFFPESPEASDSFRLGLKREASRQNPLSLDQLQQLARAGKRIAWSDPRNLPGSLAAKTHEVFYDDDGRCLVSLGFVLTVTSL